VLAGAHAISSPVDNTERERREEGREGRRKYLRDLIDEGGDLCLAELTPFLS